MKREATSKEASIPQEEGDSRPDLKRRNKEEKRGSKKKTCKRETSGG